MIRRVMAQWLFLLELDNRFHYLGSAGLWLVSGVLTGAQLSETSNPTTWPPLVTAYIGFSLLSFFGANAISSWMLLGRVGPKGVAKLWAFTAIGAVAGIVLQKLFRG